MSRLAALLLLAPLAAPVLGGCVFIKKPDPLPVPPDPPKPTGIQFDAAEGAPKGVALNNPTDPKLPKAFRTAVIVSGQELVLQPVLNVPDATPAPAVQPAAPQPGTQPGANATPAPAATPAIALGVADTLNPVRLAGIVVPTGNQTGAAEAAATVQNWTVGQDLDVQIDPVFPTDTDNKRRVAIFYKGRDGKFQGQTLSLNRMMVRSGFAVVDLYSPTSFDQKQWLLDETYARETGAGLWKTETFRNLQQRVKLAPRTGPGGQANITVEQGKVGAPATTPATPGAPATTTTTATTTNAATANAVTANAAAP